jgi:hypothetical protein
MMPNKTHGKLIHDARHNSTVIALIYSPVELQEYIVEIISKDSNHFIKKSNQIIHFHWSSPKSAVNSHQFIPVSPFFN